MAGKNKATSWSWKMTEDEIKEQVGGYDNLKITETYRGISVLLVSGLLLFSLALGYFGLASVADVLYSLIIYIPLLIFVYLGHRWAIIGLLALWALEKIMTAYIAIESGGSPLWSVIWFLIVAPYIYKALLVENHKRKQLSTVVVKADRYCSQCGQPNSNEAQFCKDCGSKLNSAE